MKDFEMILFRETQQECTVHFYMLPLGLGRYTFKIWFRINTTYTAYCRFTVFIFIHIARARNVLMGYEEWTVPIKPDIYSIINIISKVLRNQLYSFEGSLKMNSVYRISGSTCYDEHTRIYLLNICRIIFDNLAFLVYHSLNLVVFSTSFVGVCVLLIR